MQTTRTALATRALLSFVVTGATLTMSSSAHAALDEVLAKSSTEIATANVAGHTLRIRTRGNLKEFAAEDGKVFAATWSGLADIQTLLGTHYAAFDAALRARPRHDHHVVHVSTPELTYSLTAYGNLRSGTVVLNQSLPKGVDINALR
jgi:Protein of unknown function (DUF2844)